jgi:hypothetical protein
MKRTAKAKRSEIAAAGEKLEVVITAKSLRREPIPSVFIQRLKPEKKPKEREVEKEWNVGADLYGTFRCSRLVAHVGVVDDDDAEQEIVAADYRVVVENGPDPENPTKVKRLVTNHPSKYDFTVVDDI